jgi:hypothetical protein
MLFAVAASAESREHTVCYAAKPVKKACNAVSSSAGAVCEEDIDCPGAGGLCEKQGKFPKGLFAALNDDTGPFTVGEDKTFEVKKVKQVCVPVDKNDEGIDDPDTFWVTYGLKQAKAYCNGGTNIGKSCKTDDPSTCTGGTCIAQNPFDKAAAKNVNIFVDDQYTNIRVNASKVDLLMVPASLCDGNNDAACVSGANAAPTGEEHYKCYKAGATKKVCAAGAVNEFQACDDDAGCGNAVDACVGLAKFAKGQSATATDSVPGLNSNRAFNISKITHLCKAVEKTPAGGSPEGAVNPDSRLLCYKSKGAGGRCVGGVRADLACKDNDDCPSSTCSLQAKYDKENALAQGLYVNDQFDMVAGSTPTETTDYHRLNLTKEEMFCMPACEDPDLIPASFTDDVVRAVTLEIPSSGNPGDGQDVDNDGGTCAPSGNCSGGIDNAFGFITGIVPDLNTALQDAVDSGSINIVLELDQFANGSQVANGYTAQLDSPAGCTDQADGGQVCNYAVSYNIDNASCGIEAPIEFPVTIGGLPGSPATVGGGGIGSDLELDLPLGETPLTINVRNVKVGATVVHSGGTISTAAGSLGGALHHRELKAAIRSLPEGICDGGSNSGDPCTPDTAEDDCDSDTCNTMYLVGFDRETVAGLPELFLTRDIDLDGERTCEGGSNAGEPCTVQGFDPVCPDDTPSVNCDDFDSYSVGLKFTAIDAAISGGSLSTCTKATCTLY